MAKVALSPDMQRFADGARTVEVSATRYQDLVAELRQRYPALTDTLIEKHALAINGLVIHTPLLETFDKNSELVFVTRIAGG